MSIKLFSAHNVKVIALRGDAARSYGLSCPPRPPPSCGSGIPPGGCKAKPPTVCRPGPIPYNPCVPIFHHGTDTYKKYKYLFLFLCVPVIIMQSLHIMGHELPHKGPCRDYAYMRLRSKRFPWGDGNKTFFHNDHVNHLPGECEPPPSICED